MRSLLSLTLLLLITAVPPVAWANSEEQPVELVRREVAAVLAALQDEKLSVAARRQVISERIAGHFDFDDMSQSILAVNWKQADESQRGRFKDLFRRVLEGKYVSAIEKRTSEVVKVGGERIRGELASVIVTIERSGASDIPLLFKLRRRGDTWVAYDANVEGLSLVQHYRQEYAGIAMKAGIDGVLAHMQKRLDS